MSGSPQSTCSREHVRSARPGKWLLRIVFLETVAGVPGMVAAALRHMRSLRRMERDRGWIHTLLEEVGLWAERCTVLAASRPTHSAHLGG